MQSYFWKICIVFLMYSIKWYCTFLTKKTHWKPVCNWKYLLGRLGGMSWGWVPQLSDCSFWISWPRNTSKLAVCWQNMVVNKQLPCLNSRVNMLYVNSRLCYSSLFLHFSCHQPGTSFLYIDQCNFWIRMGVLSEASLKQWSRHLSP